MLILLTFSNVSLLHTLHTIFDGNEKSRTCSQSSRFLDLSPSSFRYETYWIDMGPRRFPPNMSHEIMFQTLAQSNEAIQSYPSTKAGYRNKVVIEARVNVL
jgi:hypothetical protein